jgi:signal transduction histidine kinase/ActR/RegA family two-component response regulator
MPIQRYSMSNQDIDFAFDQIKFETIFRESPIAMAVIRGPEHIFELVNAAYEALFSKREFVGKTVPEAIPEMDSQPFLALLTKVLETGEPYYGNEVLIQHTRVINGPIEDRFYDFAYIRQCYPNGRPYGVYVHVVDVTNKTLARKALEESEERLKVEQNKLNAIFYSLAAPMVLFRGPEMVYEMINSRYLEMIPERDLLGKPLLEALPEIIDSPFPNLLKDVYETGKLRTMMGGMTPVYNSNTGQYENRYFDVSCARIEAAGDKPFGIFSYAADVTDRVLADKELEKNREMLTHTLTLEKEARADAERGNLAKDLFLATLSHELRTPLSAILSWSQMLSMGKLDAEKSKRAVEVIVKSAKLQQQLISDLLDVSRAIVGKLPLEREDINPSNAILDALDTIRPLADEKYIKITTAIDTITGVVSGDKVRLQQIVLNLLTNAIKFSEKGSVIEIRLEAIKVDSKDWIRIKIIDTGKGISRHFLPSIFDRFSQADSTSTRAHSGLGLGLAIVKNLTELHGGSVLVESEGLGKGATFTVTLPLIDTPQPQQGTQNIIIKRTEPLSKIIERGEECPKLNGLRILIVDDEEFVREAYTVLLSSFGAETKSASSAFEALKIFSDFIPHVLVSDISMPGEDGYSLMQKIRALGPKLGGDVSSLALTAYASGEDVQRAYAAGFKAHLAKPVESTDLVKMIYSLGLDSLRK